MKTLALGIVLIVLLGLGGFVYRYVMEQEPGSSQVACTMEAKICPDGSGVGRQGPNCEFAPCAFPNASDEEAGIAFVVPEGYVSNGDVIGAEPTLRAVFEKPSLSESVSHTITIRNYPIPEGKTAGEVMIEHTRFQPSDMPAESLSEFDPIFINGKEFQWVVTERFEAQVLSTYYLARENSVLAFEIAERDVTDWMDAGLNIRDLPEHSHLEDLLSTLQAQ